MNRNDFLKQKIAHACEIAIISNSADNDEKVFIESIKHAIINISKPIFFHDLANIF